MQTTIQFGANSTFQEWSNFKGVLNQAKTNEKPLLKNGSSYERLVSNLTKQLQAGKL
jgi:hypothetical protein